MYFQFKSDEQTKLSFYREMDGLFRFLKKYYDDSENNSICAAVSGGSDSLSLLILLQSWCESSNQKLYCCTVDHQLRSESMSEALYVKNICDDLNIEHHILSWNHKPLTDHGKLENLAREARYDLLEKFCAEKNIGLIATGHNWNDQIETYELRKNSGSSEFGLAGMSQIKTLSKDLKLIRPLLHFSKKHLEDFLKNKNVQWKVDPMNFQDTFQRVVARKKINEYSAEKIKSVSELILNFGKSRYEIENPSVEFLKSYCEISEYGFAEIDRENFSNLPIKIQSEILRRLIWNIGRKKYPTRINEKILSEVLRKKINTLGRCLLKITKEKIFIFRENRNIPKENTSLWDNRFLIKLKLTKNQYIYSSEKDFNVTMPYEVLVGFPCLYENHKIKYGFGEWKKFTEFVTKPDLFDIFCGVNIE